MSNSSHVVITTRPVGDQFVHESHTYVRAATASTWVNAGAWAAALGGHLLSIQSAAENAWVFNTFALNNHHLWLGLTDSASEGSWRWTDGSDSSLQLWNGGEPNNYPHTPQLGEDLALMLASNYGVNGAWADVPELNPGDFGLWAYGLAELDTDSVDLATSATLTSAPRVGQTVWASAWLNDASGTPTTEAIGWQWLADGTPIGGANANSYTVALGDVGKAIAVNTTYLDGAGQSQTLTSALSDRVLANQLPAGSVTLTGTAAQGETLVASHNLSDDDGMASTQGVSYQWYANGVLINRATTDTLLLTAAVVGQSITAEASYTDGNGYVERVTSSATPGVINTNDPATGQITISAQSLTAGYEYQGHRYQLVNAPLSHADAATLATSLGGHLLVIDDLNENEWVYGQFSGDGRHLWLDISDQTTEGAWVWSDGSAPAYALPWMSGEPNNGGGGAVESYAILHAGANGRWADVPNATSGYNFYTVIEWDNASTAFPGEALKGPPHQGQILTASTLLRDLDGLTAVDRSAWAVQWLADGVAIAHATQFQYTPEQSDVDKALTVQVTYTDAAGFTNTLLSQATQAVLNVNDPPKGTVTISGTLMQGQTVTATPQLSDVDGLPAGGLASAAQYQWLADGMTIPNATGASHTLTSFSVGKHLSVEISYTDAMGTTESVQGDTLGQVIAAAESNRAPTFFNGDGMASADFGSTTESAHGVLVDSSGGIVVISGDQHLGAVRFLADGMLDTSYGTAGLAAVAGGQGTAGVLDSQGRLTVGGYAWTDGASWDDFRLVRFLADGSLDTTFGTGGVVQTAGPGNDRIQALLTQADGKLVAIGYSEWGANELRVVRYDSSGALDTTFGSGGMLSLLPGGRQAIGINGAMAADGSIYITGAIASASDPYLFDQMVLKLTTTGALDTTFGAGGVASVHPVSNPSSTWASPIIVQSDGKLLVAGVGVHQYWPGAQLVRLNADGSVDTTYGQSGFSEVQGFTGIPTGMVMDTDFQVVVVTEAYQLSPARVVKFTDAGLLDTSFGTQGVLALPTNNLWGVALSAQGDLVVGGTFGSGGLLGSDVGVLQYSWNGTPDTRFGASISTLAGTETDFREDGPAVVLDANVQLTDPELAAMNAGQGNYSGSRFMLQRAGGASKDDHFGVLADQGIGELTEGGALKVDGFVLGSVLANSLGSLQITLTASEVTQAQLDRVLRAITYTNSSDTPQTRPGIAWYFHDGNTSGTQGLGGEQTVVGYTQLNITPSNDPAQVYAPTTLAFTEDTAGVLTGISFTDPDHNQPSDVFLLRLSVSDGSLLPGAAAAAAGGVTIDTYYFNDIGLTGTRADLLAYLDNGGVQFQPAPNAIQNVSLTVDVRDPAGDWGGYRGQHKVVTLTVANTPDQPDNVAGSSIDFYEKTFYGIYDGTWIDTTLILQDDDPGLVQGARVSISQGLTSGDVLAFADTTTITGQYNADTGVLTLSGTASYADYQAALRQVRFGSTSDTPDSNSPTRTISWVITDSQGSPTPAVTSTITIQAINDAPGFAYQAIKLQEDTATPLNTLVVGDPDAGSGSVAVHLSQTQANGLFSTTPLLASLSGVTVTGDGQASMTLTGSLGSINAALAGGGVVFTPSPNFAGTVWLGIEVTDNGNSGIDGAKSSGQAFYEHAVAPVPDAPQVSPAATLEDTQTTTGLVITPHVLDGASITHFQVSNIVGGTLFLADGTTPVLAGSFITVQDGLAGLRFLPSPNSNSDGRFDVRAATGTAASQVGSDLTQAVITVGAANDAPTGNVFIAHPGQALEQGSTLVASHTLIDLDGIPTAGPDALTYQWQVSADNGNNWLDLVGATDATLLLGQNEVGQQVRVTAHYHDLGGGAETVASAATGAVANVNDAPKGQVAITGTTTQNQILTATHTLTDTDGLGTLSYQWSANAVPIAGATASTYALTQAEVGKTLSVSISYRDLQGTAESVSSLTTAVVANVNDAPKGQVSIAGTAAQGQLLAASHTLVDPDGLGSISYQWMADDVAIAGATASLYTLTQAEVGKTIAVTARYTDAGGAFESVTSAATNTVTNVNDAVSGGVVITGSATQGQTLTASHTLSDPDGLGAVAFQWRAGNVDIVGATSSTYTLTQAEVGKTLSVRASYTDNGGTPESRTSLATAVVINVNDAPMITSGAQASIAENAPASTVMYTATAHDVDGGAVLAYSLTGADAALFNIDSTTGAITLGQSADFEARPAYNIVVRVTDEQGLFGEQALLITVLDVNEPAQSRPGVTGVVTQGQTLTVDTSTLIDPDGVTLLGQQWRASGVDIVGATGTSFVLGNGQVGKLISVAVTYTDGLGVTQTLSSDATAPVTARPVSTVVGGASGDRLTGSDAIDQLDGQDGNDTLVGRGGNDILLGGTGDDTLTGGAGDDQMDGGDGQDTVDYSAWSEAIQIDLHYGLCVSAADTDVLLNIENVLGTAWGDLISGSAAANRLDGQAGNDVIRGGAGDDTLAGGLGDDLLTGGSGADTFQVESFGGHDRVLDFSRLTGDRIEVRGNLNGTGIASAGDLLGRITASANDSVIDLGNGHTLTVVGVMASSWQASDFMVV